MRDQLPPAEGALPVEHCHVTWWRQWGLAGGELKRHQRRHYTLARGREVKVGLFV